ncbi:MAG: BMP family ABC transporter substrate-binding protein [Demequina sp.]|jgi:basic membrane protein A|nr:BMP family ABC transporter substrate-binding protein [Demequina sp.]
MKNTIRFGALGAVAALALAACSSAPEETTATNSPAPTSTAEPIDYKACMVSDAGGFDDKSFNQAGYEGLQSVVNDLGLQSATAESTDEADYATNINAMVSANCDLIITVGFLLGDATKAAAEANPNTNFAIIDFAFDPPISNVKGLTFETDQAAFLAGYAAAGSTQTGTVATFGGMNIPTVTIFMDGFLAGVNYFNSENGTSVKVLGWDGKDGSFTDDFDDQTKGQNLAQGFIDQGADIIMPVAGPVGLGAAAAAKAAGNTWIIGVDSDWTQTTDYSDIILTSVMKLMGPAVYDVVSEAATGAGFTNENYVGTLENGGVGLGTTASVVPADVLSKIDELKAGIIDGSISVKVS